MGMAIIVESKSRRRRRRRRVVLAAAGVLGVASAGVVAAALAADGRGPQQPDRDAVVVAATTGAPKPSPAPAKVELRVADLMDRLGCDGDVIGTQLYSKETGRCMLGKHEITIAVFESAQLRDQWVDAGRQFGGNIAIGDGWAVWAETPDGAAAAAAKLGGQRR